MLCQCVFPNSSITFQGFEILGNVCAWTSVLFQVCSCIQVSKPESTLLLSISCVRGKFSGVLFLFS